MISALPLFLKLAGQPVIVLGDSDVAEAKRRLVLRAGGLPIADEQADAAIAFVALDQPEDVAARLRARGMLVNVPDRPELCDFTLPAIVDRAPVLVAIGTGGVSAGLAKALRLRFEALLPANLGALAIALGKVRERLPNARARRAALDAALADRGALDPFDAASAGKVDRWLDDPAMAESRVHEVVLRSDDPDDLSLREARLLGSADHVAYEPGVPDGVLDRARADAARLELAPGAEIHPRDGIVVVIRAPITAF